ncbi:MAG: hypothetical protein H0V17_00855 [Deltaproteobacteria bacterium]|nr:hypothetical protein [Deltaproteobacteria bacterium]
MAKQRSMNPDIGGEPGNDQQAPRRDREDTGAGLGTRVKAKNQGRHGNRSTGRNGRPEKGDKSRSPKK